MQQASRCQNCGSQIGAGQRFCGACGAVQSAGCAYCGSPIDPGSRFCPNCGAPAAGNQPQQQQWGQQPQQQQPGWGQQSPQQQQWGQQPPQQQPGWGQQSPQQQQWGPQQQQPGWGQPARPGRQSSSTGLLVLLLVILLVGLGGFALWQFGPSMGINIGKIFSGTSSSSSSSVAKPVITSGSIKSTVDHKSAQIVWTTDQPSSSQVEYGTTTSYGSVAPAAPSTDPTGGQSLGVVTHQVDLTGLNASTTYHYKVKSKNKAGEVVSSDQQFTTNATPVVE